MSRVVVRATIKVKEKFIDEVYSQLIKLHDDTNINDKACIQYELYKDLTDKNCFTFIETWENNNFLPSSEQKEHFLTFAASIENKIEKLSVHKLEKLI
ncbi:MAG: antibiotic biosynthesis monooxygenase [Helicobacteraceae bacterium CG2_30_36_10]|nr:MAG: antibiotic biosynthesis monooxygenase [Helicobacteraceae bacterium CG2_30_36_10]